MEKFRTTLGNRGALLMSLLKRGAVPYVLAIAVVVLGVTGAAAATGTFSGATAAPTPTGSVAAATVPATGPIPGYPAAGGGNNIVQVLNHADNHFRMDGKVKLDQIPGPNAGPKNEAFAYSSCTNCETMAVALQINLISISARNIQPLNEAVAVNYQCTNCLTYARAIQYDIQVADPQQVPPDVRELMRQMDQTIKHIKNSGDTFGQALAEVNSVIGQFNALAAHLNDKQDMATDPSTPGASPMPEPPSPSASPATTVSGAPTESPTSSPQPTTSTSP